MRDVTPRRILTAALQHPLDRPENLTFQAELPADAKFCTAAILPGKNRLLLGTGADQVFAVLVLVFRYQAPYYDGEEIQLETRTFQVSTGSEPLEEGAAYLGSVLQMTPQGIAPILVYEVLPPQVCVRETW
jgi:hypothetical protein